MLSNPRQYYLIAYDSVGQESGIWAEDLSQITSGCLKHRLMVLTGPHWCWSRQDSLTHMLGLWSWLLGVGVVEGWSALVLFHKVTLHIANRTAWF
jgi:hypothetical protein